MLTCASACASVSLSIFYFYPNAISLFAPYHSQQKAGKLRQAVAPPACTHLREAAVEACRGVDLTCDGAIAMRLMAAERRQGNNGVHDDINDAGQPATRDVSKDCRVLLFAYVEFDNLVTTTREQWCARRHQRRRTASHARCFQGLSYFIVCLRRV